MTPSSLPPAFASEKEKNREKVAAAAEALTLEWATSDESVATVDGTGLVTAVGAGEADITVTISGTEIRAVCSVAVEVKAEGVAAPETLEFTVGDEGKSLDAKIIPEDATNVTLHYESSDETIATVSAGECVIKASALPSAADASDAGRADAAQAEAIAFAETKVTVKAAVVKPAPASKAASAPSSTVPAATPAQPVPAVDSSPSDSGTEQAPDPQPEQPAPAPDSGAETEPTPEPPTTGRADDNENNEGGGSYEGDGGDATQAPGWD